MPEPSLKESLEAAYDGETQSSVGVDETSPEPTVEVAEEPVAVAQEEPVPTEEPEAGGGEAPSDDGTDYQEKVQESVGEPHEEEAPVQAAGLRPPYGWKPAIREEYWNELPEAVQREVLRREVDIAKGMEIAAEARRFKEEFERHVEPYKAEIASRGVTAMDAFDNYLSTAYKLRHAPPQEKAALVGGLIHQYGIDIGMLDQVLTQQIETGGVPGGAPQGDPNINAAVQQAMAPFNQFMQQYQNQQLQSAEQTQHEVQEEVRVFRENPTNEFYEDVREDMANLLEAASMRNQVMTLQEAYDRAILLRPDIAEIVAQRKLQTQAQARDKAAKAAQAKAVGVVGTSPDTVGRSAQPQSLRGAIEAAIDSTGLE